MKRFKYKFLLAVSILVINSANAQLGNYWTLQPGTEGTMLSGALVAANSNNAGGYYNPASLSSNSTSSFSFNTSLLRIHFLNFKNPFGPNTDLKYNTGNFDPIFLSFLVPKKNKLNIKLGFSFMGKQSTDFRFQDRVFLPEFSFPGFASEVGDYEGMYDYRLRSSEYWINFTSSRKINEHWSFGGTLTTAIRTLDYEENELSDFVSKDVNDQYYTATFQNYTKAYMYNVKLLVKLGLIYSLNEHSRIGITFTSQSLNIFGNGSSKRILSQTNLARIVIDSINVNTDDKLLSSYADNLDVNHKSPFSVSLGYNLTEKNYKVGVAIEYFHKIDPYKVITGVNQGKLINSTGEDVTEADFLTLHYGQRSIMNFAIGYEKDISEVVTIMAGFRTNFSTSLITIHEAELIDNYITDVNIDYFHITGGSTFTILKNEFILGLDFAFGYKNFENYIVNYSEPLVKNNLGVPLRGNLDQDTKILNFMLGIVLGYSFKF